MNNKKITITTPKNSQIEIKTIKHINYVWLLSSLGVVFTIIPNNLKLILNEAGLSCLSPQRKKFPQLLKKEKQRPEKKIEHTKLLSQKSNNQITFSGVSFGFKKMLVIRTKFSAEWKIFHNNVLQAVIISGKDPFLQKLPFKFQAKIIPRTPHEKKVLLQARLILKSTNFRSLKNFSKKYRERARPNFFTGFGIRYKNDIIPNQQKEKARVKARSSNNFKTKIKKK